MVLTLPKTLVGNVTVPSSKSMSNRALIIHALGGLSNNIQNLSSANDTIVLASALNNLKNHQKIIDIGDAGTAMRFLTAYLCLHESKTTLTGSKRMKERPIKFLVEALSHLGANISYLEKQGYPPLAIRSSELEGTSITMDGSISSQYISALLLIGPVLKNGLTIHLKGTIVSQPYIDMTIAIMQTYGAKISWNNNSLFVAPTGYEACSMEIEYDWSAASYWYNMVALAHNADITIQGLKKESLQGDSVVVAIYEQMGVRTTFLPNGGVRLTKNTSFKHPSSPLTFDFTACPDLAQTVAVTAAALNIPCVLKGLTTLRIKETDRINALQQELTDNGFKVTVEDDNINIHSSHNNLKKFNVRTYNDHRMAMAFSALALLQPTEIENKEVVLKSYPHYWEELIKLGAQIIE